MTNENKTVVQLMEGVEADAWARYSIGNPEQVPELILNGFMSETRKLSGAWTPLFSPADIERVIRPVLADYADCLQLLEDTQDVVKGLNEHISAQAALLVQQERELAALSADVARMTPFEYQMGVNYEHYKNSVALLERNRDELSKTRHLRNAEVLAAGQSQIALGQEIIRLQEQSASLSRAVVELTETKDAAYLAGVKVGEARRRLPEEWREQLALLPERLNDDAEMHDHAGNNSTAEDRRARAYEVWRMITADNDLPEHPLQALADESQQPSVNQELLTALKELRRQYVGLMENGRNHILNLGGDCDPVDVMERGDPYLRQAIDAIKRAEAAKKVRP